MNQSVKKKKPRPRLKNTVVNLTPQQQSLMKLAAPSNQLTEQLIERFCKLVKRGMAASVACDYLGIRGETFHKWIANGLRFQQTDDPKLVLEGLLVKRYKKAQAIYLRKRQRILHQPDNKLFYREIVILERRDKRNWGKNEPLAGEADTIIPDERFL